MKTKTSVNSYWMDTGEFKKTCYNLLTWCLDTTHGRTKRTHQTVKKGNPFYKRIFIN